MRYSYLLLLLITMVALSGGSVLAADTVCPGAASSCEADTVTIPVLIENPSGLRSFGFRMNYDAANSRYLYTKKSGITNDWIALNGIENVPGLVVMGGFHITALTSPAIETLCYVTFEVVNRGSDISITMSNFSDDLSGVPDCTKMICTVPVEEATWGHIKSLWDDSASRSQ